MKACSKCDMVKPLEDFYKHPGGKDGRRGDCKACVLGQRRKRYEVDGPLLRARVDQYQKDNAEKIRERLKVHPDRPQNRERNRRRQLAKYGLSQEQYDHLFASQQEACAICREDEPGRFWTIDHDHASGAVRGILCWHCNVALGHFRDDVASLMAAADYLLRSRPLEETG